MTLTRDFQQQFSTVGGPALSLQKRPFLFGGGYYVMANWANGISLKVARFADKASAEYWMEVEAEDWSERCAAASHH